MKNQEQYERKISNFLQIAKQTNEMSYTPTINSSTSAIEVFYRKFKMIKEVYVYMMNYQYSLKFKHFIESNYNLYNHIIHLYRQIISFEYVLETHKTLNLNSLTTNPNINKVNYLVVP